MQAFHIVMAFLVLLIAVYVALSPGKVYAPVPRVVLFFLVSVLAAVMFGSEVTSRFELQLPGFVFVTGGAAALFLGTLGFLNHLAKPEEQIAVYHIYDERGSPVDLEWPGAVEVLLSAGGLQVTQFVTKNTLVLIFPQQVGEAELRVRTNTLDPPYVGKIGYAGSRQTKLTLGKDLVRG